MNKFNHFFTTLKAIKIISFGVLIPFALCFFITKAHAQEIQTVNHSQLQDIIKSVNEKKLAVNFWASWCKPCVKEMPWMDKLSKNHKDIKVIFISLDDDVFAKKTLPKILKKLNLQSPNYRLIYDNNDALEKTIKSFFNDWDGAIPATMLVNTKKNKKYFHIGEINENTLLNKINQL